MYRDGEGVECDYSKAKKLFEQAIAKENAVAMVNLGETTERSPISSQCVLTSRFDIVVLFVSPFLGSTLQV